MERGGCEGSMGSLNLALLFGGMVARFEIFPHGPDLIALRNPTPASPPRLLRNYLPMI